jgi:hypothetical protein
MLIKSKITTLQVVRDSTVEKPHIYLKNSSHSTKDTVPVVIDINANEPIKVNDIGITFKLVHQLTGLVLKQYNNNSFVFPVVQQNSIKAILYINGSDFSTFYLAKGLDFSSRIHNIIYELDISVKTTTNLSKYTDSGNFYLT